MKHGAERDESYFVCFQVWGMCDQNACDVAQEVHTQLLQRAGALPADAALFSGAPVPRGKLWVGVYLDDLLVLDILTKGKKARSPEARAVLSRARPADGSVGLQTNPKKGFENASRFVAWGPRWTARRGPWAPSGSSALSCGASAGAWLFLLSRLDAPSRSF